MLTKICKDCGKIKSITNLYGVQGECKECTKKRVKDRYYNPDNFEKIKEYEIKRGKTEHRKKLVKIYQQNRREKNPGKLKARQKVNNAIRSGILIKKPCNVCGNKNSQAHHKDYRKFLDVEWLCFKCHRKLHKQYGCKTMDND